MINASLDQANYELFLVISWTVKAKTGDIPVLCKVGHRFPGEPPKLYSMNPIKHAVINSSNLEIDYKKYYNFGQNGKIIDLLKNTEAYFDKNPVENSAIDHKITTLERGLNVKDFLDLKNSSISDFYDQLTPNEKKDFNDDVKRLDLLKRMPAYRKVTDNHEKLIRVTQKLKEVIEEKNKKYEEECWKMISKLEVFESEKQIAYDKYSSCLMIQDRFTRRQLLTILEGQLEGHKDDWTASALSTTLEGCQSHADMSKVLMDFVDGRSQVHLGYIRNEKLKASLV